VCRRLSASPSTSTWGRILSSQRGSHETLSPSRARTAGTKARRTTKASNRTATARPNPIILTMDSSAVMNPAKTAIMMSAAATTIRALYRKPVVIAGPGACP